MFRTRVTVLIGIVVLSLWAVSAVEAALVPVSQSRSITGTAFAQDAVQSGDDEDDAVAQSFDPFDDSATASFDVKGGSGSGGGSQSSTIGTEQITASGTMFAVGEVWEEKASAGGFGDNHFEVTFQLTEPANYTLSGTVGAFDNGSGRVTLTGAGGDIVDVPSFGDIEPFNESGLLDAGTYTLRATLVGSAFGEFFQSDYASGEFDLDFQAAAVVAVPEPVAGGGLSVRPNPFRSSVVIEAADGRAAVYDAAGRLVVDLTASPGIRRWDGRDARGATVPVGIYFLRVEGARGVETRRLVRIE